MIIVADVCVASRMDLLAAIAHCARGEEMKDFVYTARLLVTAINLLDGAAVELYDPRMSYVTIQVDREAWEEWKKLTEQEKGG